MLCVSFCILPWPTFACRRLCAAWGICNSDLSFMIFLAIFVAKFVHKSIKESCLFERVSTVAAYLIGYCNANSALTWEYLRPWTQDKKNTMLIVTCWLEIPKVDLWEIDKKWKQWSCHMGLCSSSFAWMQVFLSGRFDRAGSFNYQLPWRWQICLPSWRS